MRESIARSLELRSTSQAAETQGRPVEKPSAILRGPDKSKSHYGAQVTTTSFPRESIIRDSYSGIR